MGQLGESGITEASKNSKLSPVIRPRLVQRFARRMERSWRQCSDAIEDHGAKEACYGMPREMYHFGPFQKPSLMRVECGRVERAKGNSYSNLHHQDGHGPRRRRRGYGGTALRGGLGVHRRLAPRRQQRGGRSQ